MECNDTKLEDKISKEKILFLNEFAVSMFSMTSLSYMISFFILTTSKFVIVILVLINVNFSILVDAMVFGKDFFKWSTGNDNLVAQA